MMITIDAYDIVVKGHILSALAEKLNTTIDKIKIYSVTENINNTHSVIYERANIKEVHKMDKDEALRRIGDILSELDEYAYEQGQKDMKVEMEGKIKEERQLGYDDGYKDGYKEAIEK